MKSHTKKRLDLNNPINTVYRLFKTVQKLNFMFKNGKHKQ